MNIKISDEASNSQEREFEQMGDQNNESELITGNNGVISSLSAQFSKVMGSKVRSKAGSSIGNFSSMNSGTSFVASTIGKAMTKSGLLKGRESRSSKNRRTLQITKEIHSVQNLSDEDLIQNVDLFQCIIVDRPDLIKRYIELRGVSTLNKRKYGSGTLGPTLIQWAYLYKKFEIGRLLISYAPERVLDVVNSSAFAGENVLHMAIIHGNLEEVSYLCSLSGVYKDKFGVFRYSAESEKVGLNNSNSGDGSETVTNKSLGNLLSRAVANGSFFARNSAYDFGEYPLFFAVSTNQIPMVDTILLHCFSTPRERFYALLECNRYGDNVLHYCAKDNLVDLYVHLVSIAMNILEMFGPVKNILKEHTQQRSISAMAENREYHLLFKTFGHKINLEGFTPLTVAARRGHKEMFSCIMRVWRLTQWEYGPVSKHLYDLIGVDFKYPQHYLDLIDTGEFPSNLGEGEDYFKYNKLCYVLWKAHFDEVDLRKMESDNEVLNKNEAIIEPTCEDLTAATSKKAQVHSTLLSDSHRRGYIHTNVFEISAPTALCVITTFKHHHLLEDVALSYYVKEKWKKWGNKVFFMKFRRQLLSLAAFFCFIISRAGYMRAARNVQILKYTAFACYMVLLLNEFQNCVVELFMWIHANFSFKYLHDLHSSARVYTYLLLSYEVTLFVGAVATAVGGFPMIEVIFYAVSGFLLTCAMLWYLLGFEITGRLIMSMIEILVHDVYPFAIIYVVAICGFTSAFFLLQPDVRLDASDTNDDITETPMDTYGEIRNPGLLFVARFCEMLFNGFMGPPSYYSFTNPNSQWFAELLSFLFVFTVPTLMLNLLIAIMNDRYSIVRNSSASIWLLEISSIMSRFEMERVATVSVVKYRDEDNDSAGVDNTVSSKAHHQKRQRRHIVRVDEEIEEFNLFTVLLGANHHAYVEVESIDSNWNKNKSSSCSEINEGSEGSPQYASSQMLFKEGTGRSQSNKVELFDIKSESNALAVNNTKYQSTSLDIVTDFADDEG